MKRAILVVEDDNDLRSITKEVLELDGFVVLEAPNGMVAHELLKKRLPISLIFLDLNMPLMGGREFLTKALDDGILNNIKIVIFSTTVPDDLQKDWLVLKKPTTLNQILSIARGTKSLLHQNAGN